MSKSDKTLKDQLTELEAIVDWFEQEDLDVEAAIERFEAGSALADDIKQRLDKLDNKIIVLKQKFDREA